MKHHGTLEKLVSEKRIQDLLQYEKEKIEAYKEIDRMMHDIIQERLINHLEIPTEQYPLVLDKVVKEENMELLPFVVDKIQDRFTNSEDKKKIDNYKQSILIQLRQLNTVVQEDDTRLNDEPQKQKETINKLVTSLKSTLIADKDISDQKLYSNSKKSSYSTKSDSTSDSSSSKSNNKGGNKPNDNGKGPQK